MFTPSVHTTLVCLNPLIEDLWMRRLVYILQTLTALYSRVSFGSSSTSLAVHANKSLVLLFTVLSLQYFYASIPAIAVAVYSINCPSIHPSTSSEGDIIWHKCSL